MNIVNIDPNFSIPTAVKREGMVFLDASKAPFCMYGLIHEDGGFRRMPEAAAKQVSDGVAYLNAMSAGGRIRFMTDSPYVALSIKLNIASRMSHFPLTGSIGCDLYAETDGVDRYMGAFVPPFEVDRSYEGVLDLYGSGLRQMTLNLPLYSGVEEVYIGLKEGSQLLPPRDYRYTTPVVYYGSSVTQGGCAARPGCSYQSILSRALDCDYINLGFSGNAKGEEAMANYLSTLTMSVFVMDYDYNAPSSEYLKNTHEAMYHRIREAQPDLPILILARPKRSYWNWEKAYIDIVAETYQKALAAGDKKVAYLSGEEMMPSPYSETALVDHWHPNSAGFLLMAQAIEPVLKKFLEE